MDISCDVIRDLLPLYAEDMVSNASRGLVEEHLGGCEPCKKELEVLKQAQKLPVDVDTHALERVSKEIRKRKILTVFCVIATIFSLIWSGMVFAVSPICLTAEQAVESVELREDGALAVDFARGIMGTWERQYDNNDFVMSLTTTRYDRWRARREEKKLSGMTEKETENYVKKLYSKKELSQADWDRFNSVQTRYCFTDVNGVLTIAYEPDFEGYFAADPFAPYTPAEHTYDLFYVEPGLKEPVLLWDGDDGQIYEDLTSLDSLVQQYLIFFGVSLVIGIGAFIAAHFIPNRKVSLCLRILGTIAGSIVGASLVITGGDYLDSFGNRALEWSQFIPSLPFSLSITALLWQWLYWVNHPEMH